MYRRERGFKRPNIYKCMEKSKTSFTGEMDITLRPTVPDKSKALLFEDPDLLNFAVVRECLLYQLLWNIEFNTAMRPHTKPTRSHPLFSAIAQLQPSSQPAFTKQMWSDTLSHWFSTCGPLVGIRGHLPDSPRAKPKIWDCIISHSAPVAISVLVCEQDTRFISGPWVSRGW